METVTFDADEPRSDYVPDNAIVRTVRYVGDSESVDYVMPSDLTEDELSEMSRARLYSIGKQLGIELNWGGPEAHGKEEMIEEIAEKEVGE